MLLVIGDAMQETVVDLGETPPRGGEGAARIVHQRGGSAANVAAIAAEVGEATRFAGQVGVDAAADLVIDDLRARGVDVRVTRHGRTASTVIVRSRGTTTRLVDRAGATQCTSLDPALLDGVDLVHLPATALSAEPLATAVEDLIGEALERGIPLTVDAAGVSTIAEIGVDELRAFVAQVRPEVFFCNRSESERLGLHGREPMPGARITVITAAARPTVVVAADGRAASFAVTPVEGIVDRDGAGDAFVAGYLLAHRAGQRPGTCVRAGHLLASRVLRHAGPRIGDDQADAGETAPSMSTTSSGSSTSMNRNER